MTLNNETLRTAGEALYGSLWQSDLARELGVSIRTMQRWAAGQFAIPLDVWPEIATLCRKRGAALTKLADKLRG